eukprot:CAMPEP_0198135322 /NCGR_PEP_ID=MMETSP1442-20131203/60531_1 /TAXON_ID= /ORGANISM="Craspedostauros australis, Strain CCMP3328" /LENGTH=489 /DNA_ID=CAMNT_0043796487 /DNA_START=843 /DNA_END=2312 /DNA_ORIENTATION=+
MHIPKISRKLKASAIAENASWHMRQMCQQLSQQRLKEIKLGMTDAQLSKYDLPHLITVVRNQPLDCLESLRVGWRLKPRDHRLVCKELLPLLLKKANLKKMQLILDSWLPSSMQWRFLENNSITEIDIRCTRIQRQVQSDPRHNTSFRKFQFQITPAHHGHHHKHHQSSSRRHHHHHDNLQDDDAAVCDDNIIQIIPFLPTAADSLRLNDCDIEVEHMGQLIRDLRKRAKVQTPITKLSLRNNRHLDCKSNWIKQIFHKLPELESFDISLCDLDDKDGLVLADAIANLPADSRLNSISIAGNFQISDAVPAIARACAESGKIRQLECSFCDVQNKNLCTTLNLLAEAPSQCVLRSFVSRGSRIHDEVPLVNCIRNNKSLKSLVLNNPKETSPLPKKAVLAVAEAMEANYNLTQFLIDCELQYRKFLKPMHYWLKLNRCGRNVVVNDPLARTEGLPWQTVVVRAATDQDPNVLHWFLRNGLQLKEYRHDC